jgi:O-antigen/teichoic acid export membrane protein
MSDVVIRGLTGIGLALAGAGAWSLVIGYLVGTATLSAVLWLLVPWRPRLRPRWSHLRELVRFGGTLSAVSVIGAVIANVDYVFIGRVLGPALLGLYTLGFRLPELIVVNLSIVAGLVLFPAFAAVDRVALGHAFLVSLKYTLMVALPCAAGLAALAEPLTLAAFGEKWRGSIGAMQVLSIYALGVAVGIPAGSAYKGIGRADVLLKLAIPRAALLIAAVAAFVNEGIVAVAWCQAGVAALFAAIGIGLATRLLGVGLVRIWSAAWPALVAVLGMLLVVIPIERAVDDPWATILVGGTAGGLFYLTLIWLLDRESLHHLRALALGRATLPASSRERRGVR